MRNSGNIEFASFAVPVSPVTLRHADHRPFSADVWRWAAGFYGVMNCVLYRETLRLLVWMRALNL
jgi:hypothetical protein